MDVLEINKVLQDEATGLLDETKLLDTLSTIGRVELGGSYVYGTMVLEDVDIAVIVDEKDITYDFRKRTMNLLLDIEGLDGIAMTDRAHFPRNQMPRGLYCGPLIWYNNRKWNIDIWFVTLDEPYSHINLKLHKKMLKITEGQRQTMLNIKYAALKDGSKINSVTSSEIYIAVLDNGIKSLTDFLEYNKRVTKLR